MFFIFVLGVIMIAASGGITGTAVGSSFAVLGIVGYVVGVVGGVLAGYALRGWLGG